jgi:hypothetical protein
VQAFCLLFYEFLGQNENLVGCNNEIYFSESTDYLAEEISAREGLGI